MAQKNNRELVGSYNRETARRVARDESVEMVDFNTSKKEPAARSEGESGGGERTVIRVVEANYEVNGCQGETSTFQKGRSMYARGWAGICCILNVVLPGTGQLLIVD